MMLLMRGLTSERLAMKELMPLGRPTRATSRGIGSPVPRLSKFSHEAPVTVPWMPIRAPSLIAYFLGTAKVTRICG